MRVTKGKRRTTPKATRFIRFPIPPQREPVGGGGRSRGHTPTSRIAIVRRRKDVQTPATRSTRRTRLDTRNRNRNRREDNKQSGRGVVGGEMRQRGDGDGGRSCWIRQLCAVHSFCEGGPVGRWVGCALKRDDTRHLDWTKLAEPRASRIPISIEPFIGQWLMETRPSEEGRDQN